jgi:uracil-DNA glycosylase
VIVPTASDSAARRDDLVAFYHELSDCQKCPLAAERNTVVFGTGDPDADLMFVGEAPGFNEDKQGKPFVGQAGKLLDKLLAEIGMERGQCFIANVLKCRPPGNRDPQPAEIEACEGHLFRQIELIQPRVVCSLGNFATKLLSGRPDGITKVRGVPQVRELGGHTVFLYPIFHPAAALYTPAMLERLRGDFEALPDLLTQPLPGGAPSPSAASPPPPAAVPAPEPASEPEPEPEREPQMVGAGVEADQLGLF